MSRFGTTVRTYGRNTSADNASKAFDAVFDSKPSSSMASTTAHRFGKYTFTSSRAKDIEVEPKKRKVEEAMDIFDDPFSFDSSGDEGGSKKAKVTQRSTATGAGSKPSVGTKAKKAPTSSASTSNGKTVNSVIITRKKKINDDDEDEFVVRKGPMKTYSKGNQNDSKSKVTDTAPTKKKATGRQLSMDRFAQKLATLSPPQKGLMKDSIFTYNARKKKAATKPEVKKFFTSSQDSAGLSDHNYSQSPRTISSQLDSDNESRGSSNCFLLDSDGELDSGDPEIVFNSPKKKAQHDFHSRFEDGHSDTDTTEERVSPTSVHSLLSDNNAHISGPPPKASRIGRDSPTSVYSLDSDDSDNGIDKFPMSRFKSKGPAKTYGSKLLLRKSSSEVMGIGKKGDIPTFNMSNLGTTYGGKLKTGSNNKDSESERKFTNLYGKKLDEEEKKEKKQAPLVRRLLTSPKKVSFLVFLCLMNV